MLSRRLGLVYAAVETAGCSRFQALRQQPLLDVKPPKCDAAWLIPSEPAGR
jgi:hypothetical protein